jgi:hypothetical protein
VICDICKRVNTTHHYMTPEEIRDAQDRGCTVDICVEGEEGIYVVVTPPTPDEPCDSDFMEDISS